MDMEKLAEIFEAVKVLPLRPDDAILLRCPMIIGNEQRAHVTAHLQAFFGPHRKVLIVDNGCDVEIVRPED